MNPSSKDPIKDKVTKERAEMEEKAIIGGKVEWEESIPTPEEQSIATGEKVDEWQPVTTDEMEEQPVIGETVTDDFSTQIKTVIEDTFHLLDKLESLLVTESTTNENQPYLITQLQAVRITQSTLNEAFPNEKPEESEENSRIPTVVDTDAGE